MSLETARLGLAKLRARRPLSDDEYTDTQQALVILASAIMPLKLEDFLERLEEAERHASPGLLMVARPQLDRIKRLATLARAFRDEVLSQAEEQLVAREAAASRGGP